MPRRRKGIRLDPEEQLALLEEGRILVLASHNPSGDIHLVPLWYVVREGVPWCWSYARAQKIRNLERDPRVSALVELGDRYDELRGLLILGRARLERDPAVVRALGEELLARYGMPGPAQAEAMLASATKRVAFAIEPERTVSWDHRKLGGRY